MAIPALIAVLAGCAGSEPERSGVLLEWLPPAEYDDGGSMPEGLVTEYRIYVGQDMVQQLDPDSTEYFLELEPGEWEVSISAVADGVESRLSEPLAVVIE